MGGRANKDFELKTAYFDAIINTIVPKKEEE